MNERLKELRKHLKLSQEDFASKLGFSRNHVYYMEKGDREITDRTISDVSRTFGANEEWLKYGTGEMFSEDSSRASTWEWLGSVLATDDSDKNAYIRRFIEALSKLNPDQWETLKHIAESMLQKEPQD